MHNRLKTIGINLNIYFNITQQLPVSLGSYLILISCRINLPKLNIASNRYNFNFVYQTHTSSIVLLR